MKSRTAVGGSVASSVCGFRQSYGSLLSRGGADHITDFLRRRDISGKNKKPAANSKPTGFLPPGSLVSTARQGE